jgi:hypothetical protein
MSFDIVDGAKQRLMRVLEKGSFPLLTSTGGDRAA